MTGGYNRPFGEGWQHFNADLALDATRHQRMAVLLSSHLGSAMPVDPANWRGVTKRKEIKNAPAAKSH